MEKLIDIDGNEYQTVQIGNQTWMAENLRVKHFKDGTPILHAPTDTEWLKATGRFNENGEFVKKMGFQGFHGSIPAWCSYHNKLENENIYGLLYNYAVIDSKPDIAPEGWRVPSENDFVELFKYLDGEPEFYGFSLLPGMLKAKGAWWDNPFHNESGFTALPAGFRHTKLGPDFTQLNSIQWREATEEAKNFIPDIKFDGLQENCTFWTSSRGRGGPMIIYMRNEKIEEKDFVTVDYTSCFHSGRSIRLLKD